MAFVKGKKSAKKSGRPANPANAKASEGKPVVIHLPPKLHARVRLAGIALGTNTSQVVRQLLAEWLKDKAKAIQSVVSMADVNEEEEPEVEEDEDTEEAEDEDEDEDEDEE